MKLIELVQKRVNKYGMLGQKACAGFKSSHFIDSLRFEFYF